MNKLQKFRSTGKSLAARAATVATLGMVAVGQAMAQATPPDTSSITAEFDLYKTAVVGLVIGFAVVLWAIRGAGLLKPR